MIQKRFLRKYQNLLVCQHPMKLPNFRLVLKSIFTKTLNKPLKHIKIRSIWLCCKKDSKREKFLTH